MNTQKPVVRITGWELIQGRIRGRVFRHPRILDNHEAITSPILNIDNERGLAETLNTVYELGVPAGHAIGG